MDYFKTVVWYFCLPWILDLAGRLIGDREIRDTGILEHWNTCGKHVCHLLHVSVLTAALCPTTRLPNFLLPTLNSMLLVVMVSIRIGESVFSKMREWIREWIIAQISILARLFTFQSSFISQFLDLIYWMVTFLFLMARHCKPSIFLVGYICHQNYRLQAFLLQTSYPFLVNQNHRYIMRLQPL